MIINNDYKVQCPKELREELLGDGIVNWFNFNHNDIYYDDNCNEYRIRNIDHKLKAVILHK